MFSNSSRLKVRQNRHQIFTLSMIGFRIRVYKNINLRFLENLRTLTAEIHILEKINFWFCCYLEISIPKLSKFNFWCNLMKILFNLFLCDRFLLPRWIIIILAILIMKYEYISLCIVSTDYIFLRPKKKIGKISQEFATLAKILQWPVIESFKGSSLNPSMGRHWFIQRVIIESFNALWDRDRSNRDKTSFTI